MATASITPISGLKVTQHSISSHSHTPNTSIQNIPLLIYHSVFPSNITASAIESHLKAVGVVVPAWRYTMYDFDHFHSTAHEVLTVAHGSARLCFGGQDNPGRVEIEVRAGDAIVVPAGVAHSLKEEIEAPYEMVGAYPKGKSYDMCYGKEGEEEKIKKIKSLGWFDRDPFYGGEGPALSIESRRSSNPK
jgi:uncharacterized protein YjlB